MTPSWCFTLAVPPTPAHSSPARSPHQPDRCTDTESIIRSKHFHAPTKACGDEAKVVDRYLIFTNGRDESFSLLIESGLAIS
jgi:hypothetical protein